MARMVMVMAEMAAVTGTTMKVTMLMTEAAVLMIVMVRVTAGRAIMAVGTVEVAVAVMVEGKGMKGMRRVRVTMEKTETMEVVGWG